MRSKVEPCVKRNLVFFENFPGCRKRGVWFGGGCAAKTVKTAKTVDGLDRRVASPVFLGPMSAVIAAGKKPPKPPKPSKPPKPPNATPPLDHTPPLQHLDRGTGFPPDRCFCFVISRSPEAGHIKSGKKKAHKHKSFWPVTPPVTGGAPDREARDQSFMCYPRNPRNINLCVRIPDREDRWPGRPEKVLCAKVLCAFSSAPYNEAGRSDFRNQRFAPGENAENADGPCHPRTIRVWRHSTDQKRGTCGKCAHKTRKMRKMRLTGFNVTGLIGDPHYCQRFRKGVGGKEVGD